MIKLEELSYTPKELFLRLPRQTAAVATFDRRPIERIAATMFTIDINSLLLPLQRATLDRFPHNLSGPFRYALYLAFTESKRAGYAGLNVALPLPYGSAPYYYWLIPLRENASLPASLSEESVISITIPSLICSKGG